MEKMSPRQKYDFRKELDEIEEYKGRATELISLYVPPTKQVSDVSNYLKNEYSQSSNIKSKSTRKNVMSAIESISSRLKNLKKVPPNGIVFFVGHVPSGADQTRMVTKVIEPPRSITTFMYRCDSNFYTEQLRDMLTVEDVYGLIVIDRSEATIGLLNGKRIEVIKNIQSLVPSKHGRGGQSAQRFERLIEIAAHEYFKKVGDICTDALLDMDDLKGILIGGPGATKNFFLEHDYLHHELIKKVVDTFDTGYTDEYGLSELLEKARPTLSHLEVAREKELMNSLFQEIRKDDGGLSLYGEKEVRKALELGAVDTLLVSEDLNRYHHYFECPSCGRKIDKITSGREEEPPNCPEDGLLMEEIEVADLVDELAERSQMFSSDFELISTESSEGAMLVKAFGGIAAILRYKMNL
jgi:peptide chain release factor subunit 1